MNQTAIIESVERSISQFRVREFTNKDMWEVCSWVTTTAALQLVSSEFADSLTPEILSQWVTKAHTCLVVSNETTNKAVGFCTLSYMELPKLPSHYIELCHLIVDPRFKYLFIGPRLCRAAKVIAFNLGYQYLCGRVVPTNRYALALARLQRFQEFTNEESWTIPGFRWFRFALSGSVDLNDVRPRHLEYRK